MKRIMAILCVLLLAMPLNGCTNCIVTYDYPMTTKAEMVDSSDIIVTGKFVKKSLARKEKNSIYTNYTFEVEQVIKGEPSGKVTVRIEGGRYWFERMEYVTVVELDEPYLLPLVELSDGRYRLFQDHALRYNEEKNAWGGGIFEFSNEGDLQETVLNAEE